MQNYTLLLTSLTNYAYIYSPVSVVVSKYADTVELVTSIMYIWVSSPSPLSEVLKALVYVQMFVHNDKI